MKKIFAFAMAFVSMAAVITSCSNDDADFVMQPAPAHVETTTTTKTNDAQEGVATVDFKLPVTDVQLELMDIEIRYTIAGKTYTVTTDEMDKCRMADPDAELQGVGTGMCLTYCVPGTFAADELNDATVECCIQRKEEGLAKYKDQLVNVYVGFLCNVTTMYSAQSVGSYDFLGDVNISAQHNVDRLFEAMQEMGGKTKIRRR